MPHNGEEIQDSSNDLLRVGNKIERFFPTIDGVMCTGVSLQDFILSLSHILRETIDLGYKMKTTKVSEGESYGSDCIDKETLLENKVARYEESPSGVSSFQGSTCGVFQIKTTLPTLSLEDFNGLKLEKEKMEMDLVGCKEMLSQTNFTLAETEQQLSELKSELTSCQKSNSLAATLPCSFFSVRTVERETVLDGEKGGISSCSIDHSILLKKLKRYRLTEFLYRHYCISDDGSSQLALEEEI